MRSLIISAVALTCILSGSCRKDFLFVKPSGDLNQYNLATDKGIEINA
jgi:hypothetical protein